MTGPVTGYGQDSQTMKCCVCTQVIWPGSSIEAYRGKTSTGVSQVWPFSSNKTTTRAVTTRMLYQQTVPS